MPYGTSSRKSCKKKMWKKTLIWGKKVVVFPSFLINFLQLFKWKTNFMPTWVLLKHVLYKEYPMNMYTYLTTHTYTYRMYRILLNTQHTFIHKKKLVVKCETKQQQKKKKKIKNSALRYNKQRRLWEVIWISIKHSLHRDFNWLNDWMEVMVQDE